MKYASLFLLLCFLRAPIAIGQSALNVIGTASSNSAVADFNGDGFSDFVTLGQPTDSPVHLTTYLGSGDGLITAKKDSYLPRQEAESDNITLHSGMAADFNGDGKLDLAFASMAGNQALILIAYGNGDGTFSRLQRIALPASVGPTLGSGSPQVVDLNHDQHSDLLYIDVTGQIVTLLGNGDGTFQQATVTPITVPPGAIGPSIYDPADVRFVSDLNQDGFPDLILAIVVPSNDYGYGGPGYTYLYTLLGNGHGGFGTATTIDLPTQGEQGPIEAYTDTFISTLGLQDVNGDGIPDLALIENNLIAYNTPYDTATFSVVFGKGDGTFSGGSGGSLAFAAVNQSTPLVFQGTLGDFDQDGKPDLLFLNGGPVGIKPTSAYLAKGNGDGTFADPVSLTVASGALAQFFTPPPLDSTWVPGRLDPATIPLGQGKFGVFSNGNIGIVANSGPAYYLQENIADLGGFALPTPPTDSISLVGTTGFGLTSASSTSPVTVSTSSNSSGYTLDISATLSQAGPISGTVTLNTSPTATLNLPVFGYAGTSAFTVSPSNPDFGYVKINTDSAPLTVTLTNVSGSPATVVSLSLAATYGVSGVTETDDCRSAPITTSCSITLVYHPANNYLPQNFSFYDQNGFLTQVPLTAHVYTNGPGIGLSPSSISFSDTPVGQSSKLPVTISDPGDAPLSIQSMTAMAPFSVSSPCSTIQPAGSCAGQISFSPTATGAQTGTLTIVDNAPGSPHIVPLTGTGTNAAFTATPTAVDFGDHPLGDSIPAQNVVFKNTSGSTAPVSIALSGANVFSQTNTCSSSLADGASCTVSIAFKPTAVGAQAATLTFTVPNSTTLVPISGTAHLVPSFNISPSSLSFSYQKETTTSAAQQITVTNPSQHGVVPTISATGPFAQTNNCGTLLAAAASCTIAVTFTPLSPGTQSGTVQIVDQFNQTIGATLNGIGYATGPVATITPLSLAFGNQVVNTTSATQKVSLQNTGDIPLTMQSVTAGTGFQETNTCGTVAPGAGCAITVTFSPTAIGQQTSVLAITDNAADSPQAIQLTGAGIAPPVEQLQVTPVSLIFGSQFLGSSSLPQTVTLQNTGTLPVSIQSITTANPFGVVNACGSTLTPGSYCSIGVFFEPSTTGTQVGTLTITDDAPGSPQTVQLDGTGATVSISASSGSSTSATINQGGTATYGLALTAQEGFTGSLSTSCTGAPAGFQCVPNNNSLSFTANAPTANVTFTVSPSMQSSLTSPRTWLGGLATLALLCGIFPAGFRRRSHLAGKLVMLAGACILFLAMSACGGGNGSSMTTPPPTQTQYTLQAVFTTQSGEKLQQPLALTVVNQSH